MFSSQFKHVTYIYTRFGIGVQRAAFHERRLAIVVAFLAEQPAAGASFPTAASWTRGLEMYVGENKGRITSMPWLAPSIAVATRVNNFFDPVGTHWGAGERAVATGGMGYDIVDQEPMWAWLRRRTPTAPNFGGSAVRRAGDKPTSGELFLWA